MYRSILKIINLMMVTCLSMITLSQTTTINYLTSGLSTSACNVFNPAVNVGGVTHSSLAGGVVFSTSTGIGLSTTPNSSPIAGTAYVIQYNFKGGDSYNIAITASGGNSTLYLNTSVVPNLNQFPTNSTTSCTPDQDVASYYTVGLGKMSVATTSASANYNVSPFSIPTGNNTYSYLVIWISGGSGQSLNTLWISKITITQTVPVSFALSPTPLNIQCGSTTAQTFTVTNVNNTSGVTGYSWNLGTTNNGWLYNGTAAPQTITTTTNTLSLTPACGSTQQSINATVTANGTNYPTNTAAVTTTAPSLSIGGNSYLCSGSQSYPISGFPCNASVSWSSSNTSIATVTPNGNPATVTQAGIGTITLTGIVSGLCGTLNQTITKQISVGAAPSGATLIIGNSTTSLSTNNQVCVGSSTQIEIVFAPDAKNLQAWAYSGNYPTVYQSGNQWVILYSLGSAGANYGTGTLRIEYDNTCGHVVQFAYFQNTCYYAYGAYKISPNPASSTVTASATNSSAVNDNSGNNHTTIDEVSIYNQSGTLIKHQVFTKVSKATLDVSSLPLGVYIIEIVDGTYKERQQLSIQKQ